MAFSLAGLTPPPYWWLLALACLGQGGWAVRLAWGRLRGRSPAEITHGMVFWAFIGGGISGLAYGWVQHDAVFVLGQGCALLLGLRWKRAVNKEEKE